MRTKRHTTSYSSTCIWMGRSLSNPFWFASTTNIQQSCIPSYKINITMHIPLLLTPLSRVGIYPRGDVGIIPIHSLGHWSTFEFINIQWKNHFIWEAFTLLLQGNPSKVSNLVDPLSHNLERLYWSQPILIQFLHLFLLLTTIQEDDLSLFKVMRLQITIMIHLHDLLGHLLLKCGPKIVFIQMFQFFLLLFEPLFLWYPLLLPNILPA